MKHRKWKQISPNHRSGKCSMQLQSPTLTVSPHTRAKTQKYSLVCLNSKTMFFYSPGWVGMSGCILAACSVLETQDGMKTWKTIFIMWMKQANTLVWARGNHTTCFLFDSRKLLRCPREWQGIMSSNHKPASRHTWQHSPRPSVASQPEWCRWNLIPLLQLMKEFNVTIQTVNITKSRENQKHIQK